MPHTRRYHPESEADGVGTDAAPNRKSEERSTATCGVRYGVMKWVGEFRAPAKYEPKCGARLVIQSERGIELGEQIDLLCHGLKPQIDRKQVKLYAENSGPEFYRFRAGRILRTASPQDINEHARLNGHVRLDIDQCSKSAKELNLNMKVITAEHLLGGERIIFYFRAEGRIDFRELVRQLAQHYQTRIEMRQVGARDEARLVADDEICGRECCCRHFLKKLRPVTMRMAKLQKSTLDPSKVSGRCGRLRCCLRYEHEVYDELLAKMPKVGARVETEFGPATVIDRQILTQLVMVRGDNDQIVAVPLSEIGLRKKEPALTEAVKPAPVEEPKESKFKAEEPVSAAVESEDASEEQAGKRSRRRRRSRRKKNNVGEAGNSTAAAAESAPQAEAPGPSSEGNAGDSSKRSSRSRRRRRARKDGPGITGGDDQGSREA